MEYYLALWAFDFATPLAMPVGGGQAIKNTKILGMPDRAFPNIIQIECANP